MRSGYETARGAAQRLAECARDDVDLTLEPKMLDCTPSGFSHHARAVRVVNDAHGIVAFREPHDRGEIGETSFHRKHAVRDDEDGMVAEHALSGQLPLEITHVVVLIAKTLAGREAATVDD